MADTTAIDAPDADTVPSNESEASPPAPSFSPNELVKVQDELAVHNTASRTILLHLSQRLSRLESVMLNIQADMVRMRDDAGKETGELREEMSGVQAQVESLSTQLHDVANVVDLFQTEINAHQTTFTALSTTVNNEHQRITDVNEKVDNHRDEFDTRFNELNLKLEEIPRALAALQGATTRDPLAGFTFRSAERDKISLHKHLNRADGARRPSAGPFTDLQPFTIPDDMKEKIEMKIRQREQSKESADKQAAVELANAYRRLQLAGYPRVTEIHMHVEQCRDEIKRAFDFIRSSNLQLYACCEAKVEKVDIMSIQSELKALRNRVREFENGAFAGSIARQRQAQQQLSQPTSHVPQKSPKQDHESVSTWNIEKYFNVTLEKDGNQLRRVQVTADQVPELRVSLLELSRNLNALRLQWTKKKYQPLNPLVKTHIDQLIALLNDSYSSVAEEPVDLVRVGSYVEKVASILGSAFSHQIMQLMSAAVNSNTRVTSGEASVVQALDRYAQIFTQAIGSGVSRSQGNSHHYMSTKSTAEQKKQLDQVRSELAQIADGQKAMELTLSALLAKTEVSSACSTEPATGTTVPSGELKQISDRVYHLHGQLAMMQREFVREEDFADLARQVEQWKKEKERTPISGIVGQRMTGAPSPTPSTVALRRSNSGSSELEAYAVLTGVDQSDRPKSQTRLDPLHIQRVGGDARPPKGRFMAVSTHSPVPAARNGALSKIQTRVQALRPSSGIHLADKHTS